MNAESRADTPTDRPTERCVLASLWTTLPVWFALSLTATVLTAAEDGQRIDFLKDIRPILSDKCYQCHGPDSNTRATELRLDDDESAFDVLESDVTAIIPGSRERSALYARITSTDTEQKMPPADSGKELTPEQIELLGRWIDQGAEWETHWSFKRPTRPSPPVVQHKDHVRNPIDRFVLAQLEQQGIEPSEVADRTTLIRRLTYDLTGLPPTPAEVDHFLNDPSPDAYEQLVERLLKAPRYGEQRAHYWLDAARYGDTHGLHLDNERSIWPYRAWVIRAFNNNMPFDQFTIEQIAGDLLPDPTRDQLIATGFNRCNVTTSEGGSIAEEYRIRYAIDRVETTATVWLGLTVGCAVCHDHKFDPISQKEFYQLLAYWNNVDENPMDGNALSPPPVMRVGPAETLDEFASFGSKVASIQSQIQQAIAAIEYADPGIDADQALFQPAEQVWIEDGPPEGSKPNPSQWKLAETTDTTPVYSGSASITLSTDGLAQQFFTDATPGIKLTSDSRLFAYCYLDPADPPQTIMLQFNDGSWNHRIFWGADSIEWGETGTESRLEGGALPEAGEWVRLEVEAAKVGLKPGTVLNGWAFTQFGGTVYWDHAGVLQRPDTAGLRFQSQLAWEEATRKSGKDGLPRDIRRILVAAAEKRTEAEAKQLRDYYLEHGSVIAAEAVTPLLKQLADLKSRQEQLDKQLSTTLVMKERTEPRKTFVLNRGNYDQPADEVNHGVPACLPPLPSDAPANRLGLARWLVSEENPLTARVTMNRIWQQIFGIGFVKTAEDFGSQGEWPSHPLLLDWLASEFIDSGWDVKHMVRLMVTSATYRQSSVVRPEVHRIDPENRLLSRGPRFRLEAETIRDTALAVSGLLVEDIGGKSVKPYQPAGLWEAVGYTSSNTANFVRDDGDALYRRSLYTFWKRTSPPPTMILFDAPSREACTVRRSRTNTPLQALALMNDEQFIEAARHLGMRMLREKGESDAVRLALGFRLVTARTPDSTELTVLQNVLTGQLEHYRQHTAEAKQLVAYGASPVPEEVDPAELAAWTMLGNLLLNLDETVTKR